MTQLVLDDSLWASVDAGVEALVERWLVSEGATVSAGQPLAEVVLVKATCELRAPEDGRLTRILVPAEGTFARGTPLAVMEARHGSPPDAVARLS